MRIIAISDSHCQLDKIKIPKGDLLIHSGDATYRGSIAEISKFNEDLGKIKHKFKYGILFTPGNHDWLFETNSLLAKSIMTNAKVLIDETIQIEGFTIHMSPWQPDFCNWAFNLPRGDVLKNKWATIPENTDVLVTHGPPHNILDMLPNGEKVGCVDLLDRVLELKNLKLHIFGHIHCGYGTKIIGNTKYVNVAICTEAYRPTNKPIIIKLA